MWVGLTSSTIGSCIRHWCSKQIKMAVRLYFFFFLYKDDWSMSSVLHERKKKRKLKHPGIDQDCKSQSNVCTDYNPVRMKWVCSWHTHTHTHARAWQIFFHALHNYSWSNIILKTDMHVACLHCSFKCKLGGDTVAAVRLRTNQTSGTRLSCAQSSASHGALSHLTVMNVTFFKPRLCCRLTSFCPSLSLFS